MFTPEAITYAKRGLAVFPCNGKIPLTSNGYKDASSDSATVEKLFTAHPKANIGLVTGKVSGIFVLDIDIKNNAGGADSLSELEKINGPLPTTVESLTWSGGRHIFFKYPPQGIGCRTGIRPGIDIRGDGGYVIAPPSIVEGKPYSWEVSHHPEGVPMVDAPEWLLDLIAQRTPIDHADREIKYSKGKRNSWLTSRAGKYRAMGHNPETIELLCRIDNENQCTPPLKEKEVHNIAFSVGKYPVVAKITKGDFNCNAVARDILKSNTIINCSDYFYKYNGTVYQEINIAFVRKLIADKLGESFSSFRYNEVLLAIKAQSYTDPEALNSSQLINLKNGMFDVENMTLAPHDPKYCSTIQLPVNYKEDAGCPLWINTLNGIFQDKQEKERTECIEILQEFFGLCLTKETKYEKALFLLGEGRNGKSTILYVLQHILGKENFSSVPLENLGNQNYIAVLFNKLANISIETNAKTSIYDAMFKSIISGDYVMGARKYGHPFQFFPFCKMILALNNMPQVNDKTDAFFKRLIIVKLTRQFSDQEQDRTLRAKLILESDGIFLWMIRGYQKLKEKGYFILGSIMENEISEYRKENNSVLTFVEEECELAAENMVGKDQLYSAYTTWCKNCGYRPLSKVKFGSQIIKHFGLHKDDRNNGSRIWSGISLTNVIY